MGTTKKNTSTLLWHLLQKRNCSSLFCMKKKTGKFYFCINVGLCFVSSVNLPLPVLPGFEDGFSLRDLAEQL